uniref:Uncharacterized protein n=1 Tax=Arundo donax TaxID=35708 RepID=A0A0A9GES6_ARUDO
MKIYSDGGTSDFHRSSLSSEKSKSKVFLIDLKKLLTGPVGTSSRELTVTPSIVSIAVWNNCEALRFSG